MERPLLTFILLAYNQEQYIEDAFAAAVNQTYTPLEIIISDDCSTDSTFKKLLALASQYHGPHLLTVRQTERNLGIGNHLNDAINLSSGVLIIGAAGDDISLANRVEAIFNAWLASGKQVCSIHSDLIPINETGELITRNTRDYSKKIDLLTFANTLDNLVLGATHAWHRDLLKIFGPLPNIACEDVALPPRALLLGSIIWIPEKLVKYRYHSNNLSASSKKPTPLSIKPKLVRFVSDRITICQDIQRCVDQAIRDKNSKLKSSELLLIQSTLTFTHKRLTLKHKILTGNWLEKINAFAQLTIASRIERRDAAIYLIGFAPLPYKIFIYFRNSINLH
jgi:glycosyltransferase involved in cell wall biosynthesis